jgi:hypothetical protein
MVCEYGYDGLRVMVSVMMRVSLSPFGLLSQVTVMGMLSGRHYGLQACFRIGTALVSEYGDAHTAWDSYTQGSCTQHGGSLSKGAHNLLEQEKRPQ